MDWWITFDQQAADYLPDLRIEKEEPMDRHTSFRIGGPARRMAFPERGEQLVLLLDMAARCGARPLVMGNGTNLLAPDEGLDRLVIDTSAGLSRVEAGGTPGTILAEAGASLARVADFACRQGLAGLEFAHGIPGTVGGAVCMNAGAYGGEMAQVVREATLLLPEEGIRTLTGAEMAFGYRRSFLTDHPDAVVLRAEFCLTPGDPAAIRGRMKKLRENGYISMDADGFITLNESGLEVASRVYGRHKTLSKLFVLLGVTPEVASEDACKVEHDLSEETFRCIQQYLEKMMEEQKED